MWLKQEELTIEQVKFLDEKGNLLKSNVQVTDEELIEMYKWMVKVRVFDDRAIKYQRQGRIGTYAPIKGQEAAQVGTAFTLQEPDWIYPSYREVGSSIVKGMPMKQFFLYAMGHLKGLANENMNIFPIQIMIGSQCLHAVGGAWTSKYKKEDSVSVAYIGDGGTSEGDFHEALNFAGVYKLPIVFVVQNNQWAISVPIEKQTGSRTIAQKALAYGIEGIQVDGNDIVAVYETMKEAIDKAKNGSPVLIEAVTFRQGPHTTADDPTKYREQSEVEKWLSKDPIFRLKTYLERKGKWNQEEEEQLIKESEQEVTEAFEMAKQMPPSTVEESNNYIFQK